MKWRNIALLSVLYLSCTGLYAQERIKSDSLKFDKDSMKAIFDDGLVSPDAVGYSFDYNENTGSDPITEIPKDQKIEFKLHKPFYIPPYYIDSSPRFYGDYTTGGQIFPNIYGSGMQETLPGLGRLNQASLFYRYDLNDYFSIQAG